MRWSSRLRKVEARVGAWQQESDRLLYELMELAERYGRVAERVELAALIWADDWGAPARQARAQAILDCWLDRRANGTPPAAARQTTEPC